MKKFLFLSMAIAFTGVGRAQKTIEFHMEQARAIEPIQQILVRPLVADLKILKTEMQTYPVSWQLQTKKIGEITEIEYENAIKSAIHKAALSDGADLLVASTYEVRNHVERDKKGEPIMSEMGIDIIVSGYPAKYENWRKFGESKNGIDGKTDEEWASVLIDAQRVYGDQQKTKSVTNSQ